jgi:phosphoribosyl-dephospho-CoA transferase
MPKARVFQRHDWVYLTDHWRQLPPTPLSRQNRTALESWTARRRPLVVARRQQGDAPDMLRLGLALPGKERICLCVSAYAVLLRRPAPLLLEVIESAARIWPEAMRELTAIIARQAPDTRVYGSLAWQHFAADPACSYVRPDSDIDLLFTPDNGDHLSAWIALLRDFESRWPAPRLDGEIALRNGEFMSWREFAARPRKILVKGGESIGLRPIDEIDDLLVARAA